MRAARRPHPLLLGPLVACVVAACGGSTASGPAADASSEQPTPGDGGCISPFVGQVCTSNESACQPHDPCCTGYEWVCTGGTWQQAGLGCACQGATLDAGPFTCGTAMCAGGDYCQDHPPGIAPADGGTFPDAYECLPVPTSCAATPTCACIESTLPSGDPCSTHTPGVTCTDDGAGHVILHCLGV